MIMEGNNNNDLTVPMEQLTLGRDSYSSGTYSGISESHSSSTHSLHPTDHETEFSSGYADINDGSLTKGMYQPKQNGVPITSSPNDSPLNKTKMDKSLNGSVASAGYPDQDFFTPLPMFKSCPWNEQDVLRVLREGRPKHFSSHITVEMLQHICLLMQRPLTRIAIETRRLCVSNLRRCGKAEILGASGIILGKVLAESCQQACAKAVALYSMSAESLRKSKSSRCGLRFSVGKFHKWMVGDAKLAPYVHEYAAIFLAATLENLLEETILRALGNIKLGKGVLSVEDLEDGMGRHSDLWGLFQPHQYLVDGRDANGMIQVPLHIIPSEYAPGRALKNAELCLSVTSVNSITELSNMMTTAMHLWNQKYPPLGGSNGGNAATPGQQRYYPLSWSTEALHCLRHFMSKPSNKQSPLPPPPPLVSWVRVTSAHTLGRRSWVVDADDVRQAARVLLPGADCAPRKFGPDEALSTCRHLDGQKCAVKFQQDLAFRMLSCGRSDLIPHAIVLLQNNDVNTCNEQGLSPLMYACIQGDEAMLQILLDAGANVNLTVPSDSQKYPCVHPETKHWTALTFSASLGHLACIQLLIERGAWLEGYYKSSETTTDSSHSTNLINSTNSANSRPTTPSFHHHSYFSETPTSPTEALHLSTSSTHFCETPLQVAAAAGHYEVVLHLLERGCDPYLTSLLRPGVSFTYTRGGAHNAFTLAAAHGHIHILRKLVSARVATSDVLSLEEMLAEGCIDSNKPQRSKFEQDIYEDTKNQYMTIDEVLLEHSTGHSSIVPGALDLSDSSGVSSSHDSIDSSSAGAQRFTRSQYRVLQETMYHACESGQVDIALELRDMGIPWTLYGWGCCFDACSSSLDTSQRISTSKQSTLNALLRDFYLCQQEEIESHFLYETLPLVIELFRNSKNEPCNLKLAAIFSSLYGNDQIPPIPEMRYQPPAKIDPRFVNNPELSDIQFLIEGRVFYGHKIILVNASDRFRAMLSAQFTEAIQSSAIPLPDVRYNIFEYMMQYLYHGGVRSLEVAPGDVLELMGAAHFFMLDGLQRHCEVLCSQTLSPGSCTSIYKHAKLYNCLELLTYCEAYFLQNLTVLLNANESIRKMLFSLKRQNYDLIGGLLTTLTQKLEEKVESRTKKPVCVPTGLKHLNSFRI